MRLRLAAALLALPAVACSPAATDAPDPQRAGAATSASPKTNPPTPTTLPAQRLEVTSHPSDARLTIRTADGRAVTAGTPYDGRLPGGGVQVTVTRRGYEPVNRIMTLDRSRRVTVWLDRIGQLLRSRVRFSSGSNPKQVAFTPDRTEIWSSLLGGRGVQVFDAETGRRLDQVKLGDHGAVEVIFNRAGTRAYASQMETATVYEIDTATRAVRRKLPVRGAWTKVLALSPDERTLYAANWSSVNVSEIDVERWKVRRIIPTVRTPRGLFPTPDGKRLYVAGFARGEIQRIDLATGRGKVLHRTGGAMRHLVGDGTTLYADDMARAQVFAVDLATQRVRMLAKTDEKPNTMDLSPDGKVLFVSCRGANNPKSYYIPGPEWGSVLAIDTASGRSLDALVAGNQTTGLDVSDDGRRLAISDFLDNRIRVYHVPAYAELAAGDGGRAGKHRAELRK
jgi:DNA-binding beta-propeller fold protein YncE